MGGKVSLCRSRQSPAEQPEDRVMRVIARPLFEKMCGCGKACSLHEVAHMATNRVGHTIDVVIDRTVRYRDGECRS